MNIKNFISYFKEVKSVNDNEYTALCPAHDDKNPSLSIGFSKEKNHILLCCHAGCKAEDVLSSVGLKLKDLYPEKSNTQSEEVAKTTYIYHKADGSVAYEKTRIDYADGNKKFYFKQPNGQRSLKGVQRELYNLTAVINATKVYFVEGEKCADAVIKAGRVATTLDTGAKSPWEPRYDSYLQDKEIIIIPDNDIPGLKYAKNILNHIPTAKVVKLPDLPEKGDIYDWLGLGHTMSELDNLPNFDISENISQKSEDKIDDESVKTFQKETQAEIILRLVEENEAILFHDTLNDLYAAVNVNGHKEVWAIDSSDFNIWLNGLFYNEMRKPAKKDCITQALSVLSAKARFDNKMAIPLSNRVANGDNAFWYNLSNDDWEVIKITSDGWKINNNPPILFNRYRHQYSQFTPKSNGDVSRILKYINIKRNHTLFLCWLITCFVPDIPHPMPVFFGEKGAAKSTACSLLKRLIDPSVLDTLTIQKDSRSLVVNLQQHWFLPFDNVSYINEETSDTLCRAITGGGIQQRRLHTNAEDYIFRFRRCLAINGINNVATRPDLLDRAILIELERISEKDRRELSEIMKEFEDDLPFILGGIFDTLSKAMKLYPTIKLDKLPRMADFARWGYAVGEALGGLGNEFINEYMNNQERRDIEVLNSDVVATLVIAFMKDREEWCGLVSDLHNQLLALAPHCGINNKSTDFPKHAHVLSRRLNGLKSNLQEAGISFKTTAKTQGTVITIANEKIAPLASYSEYVFSIEHREKNVDIASESESNSDEDDVIF